MSGIQFAEFENKRPMTREEKMDKLGTKLKNLAHHLDQVKAGTESFRGCDKKACWDFWQRITSPTQEQKDLILGGKYPEFKTLCMDLQAKEVTKIKTEIDIATKEYKELTRVLTGKELLIEEAKQRCLDNVKGRLILAYTRCEFATLTIKTAFPDYIIDELAEMGIKDVTCDRSKVCPVIEINNYNEGV